MNKLNIALIVTSILLFEGCIGVAYQKKLNGKYKLLGMDATAETELIYIDENNMMFAVINQAITKAGQNEDFIIVEQNYSNYYIIPLKYKYRSTFEKNYYGAFNKKEFDSMKTVLNISSLEFTIFPD